MEILILTSPNQWFIPYAKQLQEKLPDCELLYDHNEIDKAYDIVFILSYHKIIPVEQLKANRHNIVIHASALPKGKGWAPMFWQVIEGKNEIPFTMFEASSGVDDGDIYMQEILHLTGYELNDVLRDKQANFIIEMCIKFMDNYENYKNAQEQSGEESLYSKRSAKDSELDVNKTIKEQFNLLRIVSNNDYPAFFEINGHKYILKIEEVEDENR